MSFPHGITVTRLRPTTRTDGYGDTVEDWTTPTRLDFADVAWHPSTTSEDAEAGRSAILSGLTIYLPFDADVTADDRFEVDGTVWHVDGTPARWKNPWSGWAAGCVVALERKAG